MPQKIELLLESIAEAIRKQRRFGPKFPTPYDLSKIVWDAENERIEMDLWEDGKTVKYDLYLKKVLEHGELQVLARTYEIEGVEIGDHHATHVE